MLVATVVAELPPVFYPVTSKAVVGKMTWAKLSEELRLFGEAFGSALAPPAPVMAAQPQAAQVQRQLLLLQPPGPPPGQVP